MMNGLMFYYIYINLSVILYHTFRNLNLIFTKYWKLLRHKCFGLEKNVKTKVGVDYKNLSKQISRKLM
jgi:hypothetical protein